MSKYALISVYDKRYIEILAHFLVDNDYRILSTGGTFKILQAAVGDAVVQVSDFTGFPEILNGRVKTLHPKIHGGILAKESQNLELSLLEIPRISIVVVNLYPFAETVRRHDCDHALALENIDIGGHTLIRAAAKNYANCLVITDPHDYASLIENWTNLDRRGLAQKAFSHAAAYDIAIARFFGCFLEKSTAKKVPDDQFRHYRPVTQLKYGCNPYQTPAVLTNSDGGPSPLQVLNGTLGYINAIDALLGWQLVREACQALGLPAAASYKHTSPAGVGVGMVLSPLEAKVFDVKVEGLTTTATAFARARNCDPLSSFGDFIAISDKVDMATASLIKREVSDGIIAPEYDSAALEILKKKKGGGYVILQMDPNYQPTADLEYREIFGLGLCQKSNREIISDEYFETVVTAEGTLPVERTRDLVLANIALKYTQSNSVAFAYNGQVIGIGAGQQNRVDCVRLAGAKSRKWAARFEDSSLELLEKLQQQKLKRPAIINRIYEHIAQSEKNSINDLVLASDAFFPFPDSIEVAASFGIKYILQPGGSIADSRVAAAADAHGMYMACSGKRMFLH